MSDPQTAPPLGHRFLGIEAAAEMEAYFAGRSADIAAHLGISERFVRRCRESNLPYWELLERRWMAEAFVPLAPRHLLAQQAAGDRRILRDRRRAARREAWAKGEIVEQDRDRQEVAALLPAAPSPFAPPLWQRLTLALMDGLRRLTGPALMLAAIFFTVAWLLHHDLMP